MIRRYRFILILLTTLTLSACVEVEVRTKIHSDGTGVQQWTITTSALLASKIRKQIKEGPLFKGLKVEFSEEYKEGDFILRTRIPFQNVSQLKNEYYEVHWEKNGFFRTEYTYREIWKAAGKDRKLFEDPESAIGPESIKVSVEADGSIVESNADRVEGQTAHWTIVPGEFSQNKLLTLQWVRWNVARIASLSLLLLSVLAVLLAALRRRRRLRSGGAESSTGSPCPQCNAIVLEGSAFCNKCGTKL